MMQLSPQTSKVVATFILTFLLFSAFALTGFTIPTADPSLNGLLLPNQQQSCTGDVIMNGGFETRDPADNGIALNWGRYSNGQAWFGWYDETWAEAVRTGQHAQLMEIFQVEANILDRVMAISQTTTVAPNTTYNLTLGAIMRSQAPAQDRNNNEFEMHWGVDFSGQGNYQNVQSWNLMDLTEQFRLGSTGEYPDDKPLFYETITGTVQTGNSDRITLFIRGLKKFPTGTEVNFDVDDVSLCPVAAVAVAPAQQQQLVPTTGAIVTRNISTGAAIIGGLILIALGTVAVRSLLSRKDLL